MTESTILTYLISVGCRKQAKNREMRRQEKMPARAFPRTNVPRPDRGADVSLTNLFFLQHLQPFSPSSSFNKNLHDSSFISLQLSSQKYLNHNDTENESTRSFEKYKAACAVGDDALPLVRGPTGAMLFRRPSSSSPFTNKDQQRLVYVSRF